MALRRKADNYEAVKRSRAALTGAITKNKDKLQTMKDGGVTSYNLSEVNRIVKSTATTTSKFKGTLPEAFAFIDKEANYEELQEEEEEALASFEDAAAEVTDLGAELLFISSITAKLSDYQDHFQAVRDCYTERPEANQADEVQQLKSEHEALLSAWETSGLGQRHPFKNELTLCRKHLTELKAEMAGPKSSGPAPSLDDSSVGGSSFREFQHYSKIPERNLPKFNGDIMKWSMFWADFQSQIGEKEYLSDPDKVGYLRTCITDPEAAEMLHCPRQTPGMYKELMTKLHKRYDRVNEIHRTLVLKINNMTKAKHTRVDMRKLLESYQNTVESIERTGYNEMDHYHASRLYHLLPPEVQTKWDHHTSSVKGVPKLEDMLTYLLKHTEGLPAASQYPVRTDYHQAKPHQTKPERKAKPSVPIAAATPAPAPRPPTAPSYQHPPYRWDCSLCAPEKHPLYLCTKWLGMTVNQRKGHATSKKLCQNCLAVGHATDQCWSKYKCKDCGNNHHTTLHQAAATHVNAATVQAQDVGDLLITSKVMVIGPDGRRKQARALLDTGAAMNLLSARLAEQLQLPLTKVDIQFKRAMGGELAHSSHTADCTVTSIKPGQPGLHILAAVVAHVTDDMPVLQTTPAERFDHLQGLELADPFYHIPDRIDLILGLSAFLKLVHTNQLIEGPPDTPTAVHTVFGWGFGGALTQRADCQMIIPVYTSTPSPVEPTEQSSLPSDFQSFWQGEKLEGIKRTEDPSEHLVEQHYQNHVQYSADRGRYTVALPRRDDVPPLGDSRPQALARYLNHERSVLKKNNHSAFQAVMKEYFTLEHAEEVPPEQSLPPQHFYMPMHAVSKETSTTTKLRVVFDGSALTSTGVSLNQTLHGGPTIQPTLAQTLLRFRTYPIGLSADISKMYREVELEEGDKDSHRFLWRESPSQPVIDYRMTRVTFGISSSPFLAIRTLQEIANDHAKEHPTVQHHIQSSFYVDDFLAGAETVEEAKALPWEMREVLSKGGMNLCKWRCSEPTVLEDLPDDLKERENIQELAGNKHVIHSKTLGVTWNVEADVMFPDLTLPDQYSTTKRGLMSDISRIFDILGWVAPAIVLMKIQYQELWALEVGWDDQLPAAIKRKHAKWRGQLHILGKRQLPRHYSNQTEKALTVTLHGFADASMKAYGAVVYLRSTYTNHPPYITLVAAKTKVAPRIKPTKDDNKPKGLSVSRLELCGAHLLSKLIVTIRDTLSIPWEQAFAWSDSSCVLSWLDGNPRDYQVFVTNRISQILEAVPPQQWKHVPTEQNPADAASRGLFPAELASTSLWWDGPEWLQVEPIRTPPQPPRRPLCVPELRTIKVNVVTVTPAMDIEDRCKEYPKLLKSTAWWIRYMDLLKPGSHPPPSSKLMLPDLKTAEQLLLRRSQNRTFAKDIQSLQKTATIPKSSTLSVLTPFLDSDQMLRVGGRLAHSALTKSQVHPLILHSRDKLVVCYFKHLHQCLGHCGPSLLLCHTGLRYHVQGAKRLAKAVCNQCKTCIRLATDTRKQLMGQLPADRVTPSPPFYITGVDYAGPFYLKMGHVRKPCEVKAYVCVFLCFTTRAVHLEVVSDQTTEAFLATLKRFISRRGCPHIIYSDNGGNFQGARNDLMALQKMLREAHESATVNSYLLNQEINWKLSPSRSPHFGGLWEAGVKAMKYHLKRVVGPEKLTFEEFTTVLCQVEAMLNSRPLLPIDSHSTEGVTALTAGHFLIGRPLTSYPETAIDVEPNLLKTWNKCQGLAQSFWTRWATEYLRSLHVRSKWQYPEDNLLPGDIVVLRELNKHQIRWPLARVLQVYPGQDGFVRVALVKTATSTFKRPASKLALLHREGTEDNLMSSPGSMSEPKPQAA